MTHNVLILATVETKSEEIAFLRDCLSEHSAASDVVDLSLWSKGAVLDGASKIEAMKATVARTGDVLIDRLADTDCLLGLGGGTGGEIVLRVMGEMPITFPKVLVTTLPFDPRSAVAGNSVVLVPTLADICGLNEILRRVLENAAAITAGLCSSRRKASAKVDFLSVGITALGATEAAVNPLVSAIRDAGEEATVFHANGYGGAAFARFTGRKAFHSIVDLTPHELTRILIAGDHVDMPARFTAAAEAGLPQVVLPGGLNFLGLGELDRLPTDYRERQLYQHSSYFTHVKLSSDEMVLVTRTLVDTMNAADGHPWLVVPMGGFSHQDAPGGAIEDADLRAVFLETARNTAAPHVVIDAIDAHIADEKTTRTIMAALGEIAPAFKDSQHARSL